MRFANPYLLWLLLTIPALVVALALRHGWRRRMLARLGHLPQIRRLARSVSPGRRAAKAALLVLGLSLVMISLARPQAGERVTLAKAVGIDIVVALDFSKSMLAKDVYPSRVERAKAELGRLIDSLKGDRIGLVAFAGDTLSYPLTTDYAASKLFWREMSPLDMPVGGTALGKAIVAATRLLAGVKGKGPPRSQVILLLTDGEDHESDPVAAAKEAGKQGIRIFTVGIGTHSGEPVPDVNEDGSGAGYMKRQDGRVVTTRLDVKTLRQVAAATRGKLITIDAKSFAVDPVMHELKQLKRTEARSRLIKHYDEVYHWFLLPGLLLLLLEACVRERKPLQPARKQEPQSPLRPRRRKRV